MVNAGKLLELFNSYKYDDLKNALEENAREEAYKKAGKKAGFNAIIKRLVNDTLRNNNRLAGSHPFNLNGVDYSGLTNGHYILASSQELSVEASESPFNMYPLFKDINNFDLEISVNVEAVKAFAKLNKDKTKPFIIDINDNSYIGVNAKYLSDILDFCNTDKIYIAREYVKAGCYKSTIFVKSENMENISLLLPVNVLNIEGSRVYMNNLLAA